MLVFRDRACRGALYGAAWLLLTSGASAAAPTLNWFFPAGGPRGEAFEVTAGGDPGGWPVDVWCDAPGLKVTPLEEKGKFRVEPTAEALPGVYWLRLTNAEGASDLRPLILDQLPEISEVEPNDGLPKEAAAPKDKAAEDKAAEDKAAKDEPAKDDAPRQLAWGQAVELPATVNGRFGRSGDVDSFSFTLEPGQQIVARLQAQTILGSPVDAILQIAELVQQPTSSVSPLPPRTEAYVLEQNHDAHGLDPQLEFRAERAGTYVVRAFGFPSDPNSTIGFAGGDTYIYRLTLATGGIVDHALPLTVEKSSAAETEVRLFGAGLPPEGLAAKPQSTAQAASAEAATADAANQWRAFAPGIAGAAELATAERTTLVPSLPAANPRFTDAVEVTLPVVASGRLAAAGEVGSVRFAASKGERLRITLESRDLAFPLDPVVVVRDAEGKALETKDAGRQRGDVSFEFNPPADGQYAVEVQDLHSRGGQRFVYRLTVEPATPDFALTLKDNRFVLKPGGSVTIPVAVERRSGLAEAITVRCDGLPAGIEAKPVVSEGKGATAKEVKLVLQAAKEAQPTGGTIRIVGLTEGDSPVEHSATFTLTPPFAGKHSAVWLTIAK